MSNERKQQQLPIASRSQASQVEDFAREIYINLVTPNPTGYVPEHFVERAFVAAEAWFNELNRRRESNVGEQKSTTQ